MRRKRKTKITAEPDIKYGSLQLSKFINYVMYEGKKSTARRVVYRALENIREKTKKDPLEIFDAAVKNVTPMLELRSRRVGGANYQVPREVRPERRFFLACKWLIDGARQRKGKPMELRLTEELLDAVRNEGYAIKKKINVHRMAEANRAFAHFAW